MDNLKVGDKVKVIGILFQDGDDTTVESFRDLISLIRKVGEVEHVSLVDLNKRPIKVILDTNIFYFNPCEVKKL